MNEQKISLEAATIFLKAARYIETYGWQVEGMSCHGKPRCSMGALESATAAKRLDPRLATLMYDTLYDELGGISLTEFNHLHGDGDKVVELFQSVADHLQARTAVAV